MIAPRPYQEAAIRATFSYWEMGGGNPLVEMATGTGKSLVQAQLVRDLLAAWPDLRVLMLVHVKELVEQNAKALLRLWPQAPIGINAAGLGRRDRLSQILFASIQSVHRHDGYSLGPRDLVLIDECHLLPHAGNGMYRSLLERLRDRVPDMRVVGFTATPYRLDRGRLDQGDGKLFDEIVYTYGIAEGVADGWLSPLVSKVTGSEIDVSNVGRRGGEFIAGELERAADKDELIEAAVSEIVERGADRRSWIAFCTGVQHAENVRNAIRRRGVTCETVTGDTPAAERDRYIRDFRAGRIRCLTNAMVLTTGFDSPEVDLIAMLRPTLSTGLYVQKLGRGTRPVFPAGFDAAAASADERKAAIAAGSKPNCIAEKQNVLTDHGLVPIENVTLAMRVWDGEEYVEHDGVVCQGEQDVIEFAGLIGTSDHKVYTEKGWKTFGECAVEQTPIACTGLGRHPVGTAARIFRRNHQEEWVGEAPPHVHLHDVRNSFSQGLYKSETRHSGMSSVRPASTRAEVARQSSNCCQASLHQSEGASLQEHWSEGNRISLRNTACHGNMGATAPRNPAGFADRKDRLAAAFRARQPSLHIAQDAGRVRGLHVQLRRVTRVYDIVNAGPRHRFTVSGLLVSNCLVLDFAGNVRRHGPVDAVVVTGGPKKAKAEDDEDLLGAVKVDTVRAKVCPSCSTYVGLRAAACTVCDFTWPAEPPKHQPVADDTPVMVGTAPRQDWVEVDEISFHRHVKRQDLSAPPTMRVEYRCGLLTHQEWVCFEHDGFARAKAERWWRDMRGDSTPDTVDEAIERAEGGELVLPSDILIRPNGKFVDILSRKFDRARAARLRRDEWRRPDFVERPLRPGRYAVLQVKPTAEADEIKAAFRRLAKERHPDMPGGSEAKMVELNAAYEEIMKEKRA